MAENKKTKTGKSLDGKVKKISKASSGEELKLVDVLEAKKEIARMRFRIALGESVALHRFCELRKSIAVAMTRCKRNKVGGGDA